MSLTENKPTDAVPAHKRVYRWAEEHPVALYLYLVAAVVVSIGTLAAVAGERAEDAGHRERMTLLVLNERYGLMPVAQTEIDVTPGAKSIDVLFEKNDRLIICTVTAGEGVGDVEAQCAPQLP
jgi:hypothetical protein